MGNKLLANHALLVESCGRNVYRMILFNQSELLSMKSFVNTENYVYSSLEKVQENATNL